MTTRISTDVAVVGAGPCGVAFVERLLAIDPTATVVLVERGPLLLRRHFYDSGGSIHERDAFLAQHRLCPWLGDLAAGGGLLPALGGRGLLGGAQLHRFYDADLTAWPSGRWPLGHADFAAYFELAENALLGARHSQGPAQEHATELLAAWSPKHPPHASSRAVVFRADAGFPHQSAVERILALSARDADTGANRLRVLTDTRVVRLAPDAANGRVVSQVVCRGSSGTDVEPLVVAPRIVVLAASAIESARLVLTSGLPGPAAVPAVGRYLAEHVYVRGLLDITAVPRLTTGPVNLYLPPAGDATEDRFQIEIRTMGLGRSGEVSLRVTGSAAMDPDPDNRVEVAEQEFDESGVPQVRTVLRRSHNDRVRTDRMIAAMGDVAQRLGGTWAQDPTLLPAGASYHEAGTLRIGEEGSVACAAESSGRLLGTENVYVGDAAAFPSVGVANPLLTSTAMAYRLADHVAALLGHHEVTGFSPASG